MPRQPKHTSFVLPFGIKTAEELREAVQALFNNQNDINWENARIFDIVFAAMLDGVLDHGFLAGLADDDHTQYILVAGTRAFTGNQSMGSNKLTNLAAATDAADAVRYDQLTGGTVQSTEIFLDFGTRTVAFTAP